MSCDSGLIKSMEHVGVDVQSAGGGSQPSRLRAEARASGRTQPGVCHRLFTKGDFKAQPAYTEPEIKRMALDAVLLHLRVPGFSMDEVLSLELMDDPGKVRWAGGGGSTRHAGSDRREGRGHGRWAAWKRCGCPDARTTLLASEKYGCVADVATIVAGLTLAMFRAAA